MHVTQQCCSLAQAQRLFELGVIGPSLFYWSTQPHPHIRISIDDMQHAFETLHDGAPLLSLDRNLRSYCYSAYTFSEMALMMPSNKLIIYRNMHPLKRTEPLPICTCMISAVGGIYSEDNGPWAIRDNYESSFPEPSEAVGLAQIVITMLEAGEITAASINARLTL